MKKLLTISIIVLFFGFLFNSFRIPSEDIVVLKNKVFEVTYSQKLKQPLTLEYKSTNRPTNVNRGSMDFYSEPNVITSGPEDYKKNEWDKGHLAPAATFSDSEDNLNKTFSFVNCAMQIDDLNRGEWAQLEQQVRDWSASLGSIRVRIELVFDPGHEVRETGVHIPTGFWKNLTYSNGDKECYYFPNAPTTKNWDKYLASCN